jgi:hypothetical protein
MMSRLRIASVVLLAVVPASALPADGQDAAAKPKPLFREFMGLNVHTVQFKPRLYRPLTRLLRDYHGFEWDVGNETDYRPRFPLARNGVNWETLYGDWNKAGYSIDVCLMFDTTQPNTWRDVGRDASAYGFQFAQFFGPSGKLKLAEAVEIGNEPGKYDDTTYRNLFESAARGMRRGDPKLLISTCAVFARPSGAYHKDIATVKGLEALYDVISVHSYPDVEGYPTWRRSFPEDPQIDFLKRIREVIAWRDANARGKQIWLTEFGYDATTQPQAKDGDFKRWVGVTDVQQAQYLVRAFLILAELDVERAYIYWFNDDDKAMVHASSGLTRHYRPKPSFHALAHLFATLGDYRFARVIEHKPGEFVSEFQHGTNPRECIWVVWSPTGERRKANARISPPPGRIKRAERMPLTEAAPEQVRWSTDRDGGLEISIDESPVFVWWDR